MMVFTEECLYMRAHLGYDEKRGDDWAYVGRTIGLGRHAGVLYTIARVWALCGLQDGKMPVGRAPA